MPPLHPPPHYAVGPGHPQDRLPVMTGALHLLPLAQRPQIKVRLQQQASQLTPPLDERFLQPIMRQRLGRWVGRRRWPAGYTQVQATYIADRTTQQAAKA